MPRFTAAEIRAAHTRIPAPFRDSPQFVHEGLSARLGVPVVVKLETLNPIRAFKGRGTWLVMEALVGEGRLGPDQAIVVASSGNFGQGIAYAGRALGVPVAVYVAESASDRKVGRMAALGATVVRTGRDFDQARVASERHVAERGGLLVVDGEDPRVAIGNGTMAMEVTDAVVAGDLPPLVAAFVPVGNGALIAGVGTWLRSASPATRVIGVGAQLAPSMQLSWRAGRPIETETAELLRRRHRLPRPRAPGAHRHGRRRRRLHPHLRGRSPGRRGGAWRRTGRDRRGFGRRVVGGCAGIATGRPCPARGDRQQRAAALKVRLSSKWRMHGRGKGSRLGAERAPARPEGA